MDEKKTNGGSQELPPLKASVVRPLTPTNKAIYEAGKSMLIESVSTGREFCKFMIGTAMSAIPIYLGLLKFVLPEKYVPTLKVGLLALIPAILFLLSGIIFMLGYFPEEGRASLDLPDEIERERSSTVRRRQRISVIGFTVFCVAIMLGLLVTGRMLTIPRQGIDTTTVKGTQPVAPADHSQPGALHPPAPDG